MTTALLIIVGVLLFNFIIFAHEFGHFFWAKKFGVTVNEFAIGMGPQIFKFNKNGTDFSIRLFPIGGFCEMEGEDEEVASPGSFSEKTAWQKMLIIASGAIMNIIVGFVMTLALLIPNESFTSTTIQNFVENASSSSAGLKEGDKIIGINGKKISTYKELSFILATEKSENFNFDVKRGEETKHIEGIKFKKTTIDNKMAIQVDFRLERTPNNFVNLFKQAFLDTVAMVKIMWSSLIGLLAGKFSFKEMSGPIGIISEVGKAATEGLKISVWAAVSNIVSIMAFLTINLGVFNLLPLPALDGGRLMFLLFELITRKKVNQKYEGWIHALGFFLFIALMLWVSYSDIMRLLGKI